MTRGIAIPSTWARVICITFCAAFAVGGCSSGAGGPSSLRPAAVVAAAIADQPRAQSVPMGLTATFAVSATGSSLQYQWAKNGASIDGATGSSYTTPATTFADSGSSYTVSVSNTAGAVTSAAASLTVTARAPMPGDLRFQQVDASSTVNGWGTAGVGESPLLSGRFAQYFAPSLGSPFYVGSAGSCGPTPVTDGSGCAWEFSEVPFTASSTNPTLLAGYASDFFGSLQADLTNTAWPNFSNGASPSADSSVITSMDLEPANDLFAVSWIQSAQQSGFGFVQNTVTPAQFGAAAVQEGASSRVITAVSYNAGSITYVAYSWQADTSTLYETQVVNASPTNAPTAAAQLAAQGFIITATGTADGVGNVLLVGTRVQGDTMARPFVAVQGSAAVQTMMQEGYANIGVIFDSTNASDPYTYLGER